MKEAGYVLCHDESQDVLAVGVGLDTGEEE